MASVRGWEGACGTLGVRARRVVDTTYPIDVLSTLAGCLIHRVQIAIPRGQRYQKYNPRNAHGLANRKHRRLVAVNNILRSVAHSLVRVRPATVGFLAAVFSILALASVSLVSAQTAELRISELQCNGNPETVTITNQGSAEQDLAGWTLQSDPVGSESFDLSVIGVLGAGVSVFVESGPSAQGSYVWSTEFVLRDSDATDFARIVNANGAVVHEVKCQSASPTFAATAQPTPTAAPTTARPTSTAAPATASTNLVPDGGGPPGRDSWQSGGLMILVGSWLLAAAFGVLVVARLRSDRTQRVVAPTAEGLLPAIHSRPATPAYSRLLYLLLVLVLAAVASWSNGSDERRARR